MSTLSDIRTALAAVITAAVPDVHVYAFATDNLVAPAVIVFRPDAVDYRETFTVGTKRYLLPVQCRVQRVVADAADDELDELAEAVANALLANPDLDGAVDSCDVVGIDTFGIVTTDDGVVYLACNVNVEMLV